MPRYNALMTYYSKNPPVHVMLAGFLGYGPKKNEPIENANEFMPVAKASETQIDDILRSYGIEPE